LQWLVALFGGEVVPLSWAGIASGRHSRGHRFLANGSVEIAAPDAYVEALRAAHVVVDPELRRDMVRRELARLERETGLRVRPDEALLAEVIHLGEYPVGVSGTFDPSFLEVPEEIIVSAMRTHQRYFAMEDAAGKLANRFATLMATIVKDPAVVQRGNEYVIASRLADAKFFFAEDRKKTFAQWNDKLASVVFQAKLGDKAKTIGHKLGRIEAIVTGLAERVTCDRDVAVRAARLAKADLGSSAVGEFSRAPGRDGQALRAPRGPARRRRGRDSKSTTSPRARAARCRRRSRAHWSRSPTGSTPWPAASRRGSRRRARPTRSGCAARRSACSRSCSIAAPGARGSRPVPAGRCGRMR